MEVGIARGEGGYAEPAGVQQVERDFVTCGEATRRCRQQPQNPNMRVIHNVDSKQSNRKCTITTIIVNIIIITVLILLLVIIL